MPALCALGRNQRSSRGRPSPRDVPHLKWILIGGGHEESYRKKAQELSLPNWIFTGHLINPFPAIASLDHFALLSNAHEGVSQASLQAAYLEKPLLMTQQED